MMDTPPIQFFSVKQIVKPENLRQKGMHSQYKADDNKVHEQERDLYKVWVDDELNQAFQITLFGMENQTRPERFMPARIIGYDGASYRSQLIKPHDIKHDNWQLDNLVPVITIVLYFGRTHWEYSKNLKDLMKVREELEPYVNDYKINVFEISFLSDEEVSRFTSDFKVVADFFVKSRTIPNYVPDNPQVIKHVDEVLKLMAVMTGDRRYEEVLYEKDGKDKVKTMCEVTERLVNTGISQGRDEGQSDLAEAIHALKEGQDKDSLLNHGYDEKTVDIALTCL